MANPLAAGISATHISSAVQLLPTRGFFSGVLPNNVHYIIYLLWPFGDKSARSPGVQCLCTHPRQGRPLLAGRSSFFFFTLTLRVSLCLCVHSTLPLRYVKKVYWQIQLENTHTLSSTGCVQQAYRSSSPTGLHDRGSSGLQAPLPTACQPS